MMMALMVLFAALTEIRVDLKLDASDFIVGERIRGVVDVVNSSPDRVAVGVSRLYDGPQTNRVVREIVFGQDAFFVEVFRASDLKQMTRIGDAPFISPFSTESGEGQKLETFLGDHYGLFEPSRYLAKPVLVHKGVRYEGQMRAFDVVGGVQVGAAMQMFANHPGLQREFELVYCPRNRSEHLFLKAKDGGTGRKRWETRDLGAILRLDKPTISVLPTGEVIVLHRLNQDLFVRSELWSLPNRLVFRKRESIGDPETAGTARVRELYKKGGVKPKDNPWWKFW